MVLVGVDTSVRDQSKEVKAAIALLGMGERLLDVLNLGEFSLLHDLVDTDNLYKFILALCNTGLF